MATASTLVSLRILVESTPNVLSTRTAPNVAVAAATAEIPWKDVVWSVAPPTATVLAIDNASTPSVLTLASMTTRAHLERNAASRTTCLYVGALVDTSATLTSTVEENPNPSAEKIANVQQNSLVLIRNAKTLAPSSNPVNARPSVKSWVRYL